MKTLMLGLLLLSHGVLASEASKADARDPATRQVLDCVAANLPQESFSQAARLTITDAEGSENQLQASFAGMRAEAGLMLNIAVSSPVDLAGTALLLKRDDKGRDSIKLYLPALRRVRTVNGAMDSQGILGSDFSYRDLMAIFGAIREGELSLLPRADDEAFHHLLIVPAADQQSPYQRITALIDKRHCVPHQLSFEMDGQGVVKTLSGQAASLHSEGGRHMLLDYTMVDRLKGSHTRLLLGAPMLDQRIARSAFHPSTFYNFKNRAERPD